ncbi:MULTISPECIES: hypothetical protein [unclassified Halomonas]|uniref:hypothetical protein n=1 Tax=unclassified Halomonas TaxID=2609666 RepID=UPI0009909811|nr:MULTISPECIES: hypothetical protein [unclassified Halomonas]AQU83286.1 hypothetical protein B2G49_12340 [Halomonas sp. 'Soap Lake \
MDKQIFKRPRVLTLCMLAATVSTLALAGCGNGEEELPPAQQPETMEQDATTQPGQAPGMENDPAMSDEPAAMDDPGLSDPAMDDPAASQEPMPGDEPDMDETDPDAPGFGEGTDPMPGADETENDDELTNTQ